MLKNKDFLLNLKLHLKESVNMVHTLIFASPGQKTVFSS